MDLNKIDPNSLPPLPPTDNHPTKPVTKENSSSSSSDEALKNIWNDVQDRFEKLLREMGK